MGLIKYGPLAEEVSGTVGGVTFARSYTGKTCRTWRAPTNKRTWKQFVQRGTLAHFAHRWHAVLTSTQRALWDAYAGTIVFNNPLGEEYFLNGFNAYVRQLSTLRAYLGEYPDNRPSSPGFPEIVTMTFAFYTSGDLHWTGITPNNLPASPIVWAVHGVRPITREYPYRAPITKGFFSVDAEPPITLCNLGEQPIESIGNSQLLVISHFADHWRRLSKPIYNFVVLG